jgi:hypothetical protein
MGFLLTVDLTQWPNQFFYTALPFGFVLRKKRKTGRGIGLKNKWFVNGKSCKKDLS